MDHLVMATRWFPVLVVVAAVWCSIAGVGRAAVISIDFGSEWLKVALVKVLLENKDS